MDLAQTSFPTVNGLGCVKVLTNTYSVPLPAGAQVQAKAYASSIELWHEGRCVARHERCYRRQQQILDLEHYLDVLYRKPGALAGSKPLEQKRQAGLWPPSFDRIWEALMERHGKQSGTRQMIDLLKLSQKHGQQKLQEAIESALSSSCYDAAAVQHLLNAEELRHAACEAIDVGALERYARPLPVMLEYDQLLTAGGGAMSNQMAQLQEATIKAQCKALRMPMIASQFGTLAEQAIREKKSHIGYLEALLLAEIEERERNTIERRIREAHLPRVKTLEEFDYTQSPNVTAAKMRDLAEGGYIERAEPVLFIGECGTGKTHLLTGLCVAACRQKRRVRFTTAAGLVNELVEAKHQVTTSASDGSLEPLRSDRHRRSRIRAVGRGRRRVPVSGRGRASREGRRGADDEPAVFRVDAGHSERAAVQSAAGSHHRSRSHPGDRHGILSLPPNRGEAKEGSQNALTGQAVEMTVRGKPGKPKAGFPPFPPPLEIAARFPHSHRFDDCSYI